MVPASNAVNGDRERGEEAGMNSYVGKPREERKLVERIEAAMPPPAAQKE